MQLARGTTVLLTGASSGIGHAAALAFARRGCSIVLVSRSAEALASVAREVEDAGGRALPLVCDVANAEAVEQLPRAAAETFGRLDIVINNAAVAEWSFIEDMTPDEMRRVIEVNLLGPMYLTRASLPYLRANGGGVIINVASALAFRAVPLLSTYSASKAALKSFSDALRMELHVTLPEVEVVTILPATINTPFYRWGRSKLGVRPHPIAVIYPPQAVADAIVSAAERPQREIVIGAMGKLFSLGERLSPRAMDWYMLWRRNMFREQFTAVRDAGESNLFDGRDETDIEGDYTHESRATSVYTRAVALQPHVRRAAAVGLIIAGLVFGCRIAYRTKREPEAPRAGGG